MPMNPEETRRDFPLLSEVCYLDSAATSLSPEPVLQAMLEYERHYRANVGRGVHRLSQIASQKYWDAHRKVAAFIGAEGGETVFTRNTTEAITLVAEGLSWNPGDRVVTTLLEHHSNLLPWMRLRDRKGVNLTVIPPGPGGTISPGAVAAAVDDHTRLVAVTHASNVLGNLLPVREIGRAAREHGALLLVDGAQSVPHIPVRVRDLGCDFLCFSGHKMLGPTGTGVLWMQEPVPEPLIVGGGSIDRVTGEAYTLTGGYARYEAGTPNIAGGIGLGRAVDYLQAIGMAEVQGHEERLTRQMLDGLRGITGVTVYGPGPGPGRIGVVSFTVEGLHPHEVAHALSEREIMVRSGHHCCMPFMDQLGLSEGTVRASLHVYSSREDVDRLVEALGEIAGGM
ncbi:MAG: aminotransferase, class [Methanomicrobia archaeon]|nr:aminotransferase, class [Methanomicrobia archaeon]